MRIRILTEESGSVEIERMPGQGCRENIGMCIDMFRGCLLALGYHPDLVDKFVPEYESEAI